MSSLLETLKLPPTFRKFLIPLMTSLKKDEMPDWSEVDNVSTNAVAEFLT